MLPIPQTFARHTLLTALFGSACVGARPEIAVERDVAAALALSDAIELRAEGAALDEGAVPDELTLADAVRRAVRTSPELQAALARVRAAEADADLAAALPNPILSVVLRFPEGGGATDVEAGLGADLLALLTRPRRASAAGNRMAAEAARTLSTALDVVAETQELYASAQALEELVPLLEGRAELFDRLRDVAHARLELGEGTRHETTSLEAERLELAVEVERRRAELYRARLALARRIGAPSDAAGWRLDARRAPPMASGAEAEWIEAALRARPEVLALEWELAARGDELALAGGGALEGASLGVDAEREDGWAVGPAATVPLPLFDTGGARRRRASALDTEMRHRLVEARRTVVEEVRAALAALAATQANLARVTGELVPLQEQRRAEVEEAYRLGVVDVTELLLAEQALQESHALRIELEREVATAALQLERAVGGRSVLERREGGVPQP